MSTDANKDLVRRYQEAHNANNLAALDAIVAADLITHSLMPGVPPGRDADPPQPLTSQTNRPPASESGKRR